MEFGLTSHSLFGGNGTQLNAKSSALPHFVLLPKISPFFLGSGFTFRVQFHIYFCQVKPRKNKAMVQIYVHTSCLKTIGFVQNQIIFSGWSNLLPLITFWCSQTVLLVKSQLVKSLRYFHY